MRGAPHSVGGDFCNLQRESRLGGERDQPQATTAGPQEPKRRASDSGCPTGALVAGRGVGVMTVFEESSSGLLWRT